MRFHPDFVQAYLEDNMTGSGDGMEEFEAATDEWENVAEIEATFAQGNAARTANPISSHPLARPLTLIDKVIQHLSGDWMDPYLAQVRAPCSPSHTLVSRVLSCLPWAPPPLPQHLQQDVRRVLATALVPLDNSCPTHLGMLNTLYRQLMATRLDPPRYGGHWEDIGFQGTDPSTDLRGVGLLGLVQATHLVTTPELLPLARAVHTLSRDPAQEFPLLVLAINVSRISLHALRDGLLHRLITEEDSVWAAVNTFYTAVLAHVFARWRHEHLTISSSGFVLQEAEQTARRSPALVVRRLEQCLATEYSVEGKQLAREQIERDSKS